MFGNMKSSRICLPLIIALISIIGHSAGRADDLVYAFRGVLPPGASSHSSVSDGETFTAYFTIATEAMDSEPDPTVGDYNAAVMSGTLTFSGGYVSPLDFSNYDVLVFDNAGTGPVDGVSIRDVGSGVVFQASNRDLSILSSDSLPPAGTQVASGPDPDTLNFFQLTYADPGGSIEYGRTRGHQGGPGAKRNAGNALPRPCHGRTLPAFAGRRRQLDRP
jgi:hypothetical protein